MLLLTTALALSWYYLSAVCVVCDMDQFFAAVEARDNPDLKNRPFAVGGEGMICTANYVARKFGVRSAMPGFIGKQLCKELVFVKPDFSKYKAAAGKCECGLSTCRVVS